MTLWTPHVAIRLPQVCSSQRVYLKGEPGPARVVGRPCGSLVFAYISPQEKFKMVKKGLKNHYTSL